VVKTGQPDRRDKGDNALRHGNTYDAHNCRQQETR